jgi:hypothetical protein
VGLRRRQKAVDLVKAVAVGERAVETALVGDEHAHRDCLGQRHGVENLLGVRKLGNDIGPDEARHLQARHAALAEQLDQAHLVGRGDDLGLVLKTVARADLANPDAVRNVCHR